jgi:hypothetical protein
MLEHDEYEIFDLEKQLHQMIKGTQLRDYDTQALRAGACVTLNWMLGIFGNREMAEILKLNEGKK